MVQIVFDHYGEVPWLNQVRDGVVAFVTRCVHQLNGPGPEANAQPLGAGGEYTQPARTKEEIAETPAASDGQVSRAPRQFSNDDTVETVDRRGELRDPVQRQPAAPQQPSRRIVLPGDPWSL